MENNIHIREKEQLEFLKKEFVERVIETSNAVKDNKDRIDAMEKGKEHRSAQINKLDKKLDLLAETLNDDKYSSRKGVTSMTLDNHERISILEVEARAWKRASVIIGGLITGLIFAGKYLWTLLKQILSNEIN
jgi:hypothetical protein